MSSLRPANNTINEVLLLPPEMLGPWAIRVRIELGCNVAFNLMLPAMIRKLERGVVSRCECKLNL